jgi:4-hydroxy-3-methylbut-2-enyl diphosphate reductase
MEVKVAKGAGFCFGVKQAMNKVYEQLENGKTIYTYGAIVHNEEVLKELEEKGVRILHNKEDLMQLSDGVVIIRSHGVAKEIYDILEEKGLEYVDATCHFVKRIHNIARQARKEDKHIVIIGNPTHPEVEGIIGWCDTHYDVLETPEEARQYDPPIDKQLCIVAQTTFNYNKFQHIVEIFEKKGYNGCVVNTICNATEEKQNEARAIARAADVMIVIGGKHSSNTSKLYEICSNECANTYFIQTLNDLHLELPKSVRLVGITAGASTPNKIIEEVQNYVRINF